MSEKITLREAINIIRSGVKFNIAFCTYDGKRKHGGNIEKYENCTILSHVNENKKQNTIHTNSALVHKNPYHWQNDTINILLANNEIRKIHVHLIESINQFEIIL